MTNENKASGMMLFTIMVSSMLVLMGGAAVAPALPGISEAFPDASEFVISLIITLPSLSVALTGMLMGRLADNFGKVKTLILSLVILALSGMSGYFLNDLWAILIGRFVLGIGIGGITASTTALISEHWTGHERMKILGYQSAANGVGALILESSGGVLADINWRYPFLIYGIGLIFTLLTVFFVKEAEHKDVFESDDMAKPADRKIIAICYVTIFLAMLMMFALPTKLTYLVVEYGYDATLGGILLGLFGACNALVGMLYGRVSKSIDAYMSFILGFCMMAVSYLLFLIEPNIVSLVCTMILFGAAMGTAIPAITSTLAKQSRASTSGKIMGGYGTFLNLGQFTSGIVLIFVIDMVGGYRMMYIALGCICLIIAVVYAIIRKGMLDREKASA